MHNTLSFRLSKELMKYWHFHYDFSKRRQKTIWTPYWVHFGVFHSVQIKLMMGFWVKLHSFNSVGQNHSGTLLMSSACAFWAIDTNLGQHMKPTVPLPTFIEWILLQSWNGSISQTSNKFQDINAYCRPSFILKRTRQWELGWEYLALNARTLSLLLSLLIHRYLPQSRQIFCINSSCSLDGVLRVPSGSVETNRKVEWPQMMKARMFWCFTRW